MKNGGDEMTDRTGGQVLVDALAGHAVDTVFGIPGTHNLAIYAALPARGVRHVLTRHEQGAAHAADGYARASGRVGVCLTTTGPAVLNAASAIGQSYSDSVPVLLVSPGMPLRHPGRGNGELHETKDQRAALDAVAAYSHRVASVAEIPAAVAQAFVAMTSGRPRPVHLEIPLDLLDETAPAAPVDPLPSGLPSPAHTHVTEAARRLAGAQRPGIVAGGGARGAEAELTALAERLQAPVVTTVNGKGAVAESHSLSLGAGLYLDTIRAWAADRDAVCAVGTELAPADTWYGPLPLTGSLVRIDIDAAALATNAVPDVALHGDAAETVNALLTQLDEPGGDNVPSADVDGWKQRRQAEGRHWGASWQWITDGVAAGLSEGIVAGDNATVCNYGAVINLPAYRPGRFLYPTGFGTLGYALPAAIGAKIAYPDYPVAALTGDGGLMFTVAELATAAELGIALPVIVVDNGGYGEIRQEMRGRGDPVQAVDLAPTDMSALARGLGCLAATASDAGELAWQVRTARSTSSPTLIHVHEPAATPEEASP